MRTESPETAASPTRKKNGLYEFGNQTDRIQTDRIQRIEERMKTALDAALSHAQQQISDQLQAHGASFPLDCIEFVADMDADGQTLVMRLVLEDGFTAVARIPEYPLLTLGTPMLH